MHEHALMRDLVARIEATAQAEGASRVTRVTVQLGALSHFTPHHFREHFEDATRATLAEGAVVDTEVESDMTSPRARDVVLMAVEVEI
jgi:hydrogenase nickel incorporation protein HypA/HybF